MKKIYLKPICRLCSSTKIYEDARLCYNCRHLPNKSKELEDFYETEQIQEQDLIKYGKDLEIPLDIVEVLF